jgi:(1->4)-alpha-D-glucan 1-alpha-D-glucosylmutase
VALNEVGGEPVRFGVTPAAFHAAMTLRAETHPAAMLAGSTHDTKRSEEVRARLVLLSELPEAWSAFVERVEAATAHHRSADDLPDRATRYLLWQTLVGAWPIEAGRLADYMEKAVREAKRHTSWNAPDEAYEAALRRFVEAALADRELRDEVKRFVGPLVEPGRRTSLAMLLLRLTAPGVPDLYQGSELWDASLVDPDNRRPVDFERRRELLGRAAAATAEEAWADRESGLPRIWLTRRVLQLRAERPELFAAAATYRPLDAAGDAAARVVAFSRGERLVVVVPRLAWQVSRDGWGETWLPLPPGIWRNALTDATVEGAAPQVASLLERFPVALLVREA